MAGTSAGRGLSRYLLGLVRILVMAVLAIRVISWLGTTVLIHSVRVDAHHLESKMVYLAREFRDRRSIYPDWKAFPYESNFYGPVYFSFVGLVGRVFGLDDDSLRSAGRLITNASVFVLAWLAAAWTRRASGDRGAAAIAALAVVASAPMLGFGQMVRPDLLAVALGVAGFFAYTAGESRIRQAAAVWLFALATLTKQIAIVPLAALLLWRLSRAEWRAAILLAAGWAGSVLTVVMLGTVLWDRRLASDMIGSAGDPFRLSVGLLVLRRVLGQMPELWLSAVAACWLMRGPDRRALLFYGLAAGVWGSISCFKVGADLNYFTDLGVFGAIAIGLLWQRGSPAATDGAERTADRERRVSSNAARWLAITAWSIYLILTWIPLRSTISTFGVRYRECTMIRNRHQFVREYDELVRLVRSPDRRVLTDSPYLAFRSVNQPPFLDPVLFRCLVQNGRVHPTELLRRIEAHEYDLVLSTDQIAGAGYDDNDFGYPPPIAAVIRRHYAFRGTTGGIFLYVPRATE